MGVAPVLMGQSGTEGGGGAVVLVALGDRVALGVAVLASQAQQHSTASRGAMARWAAR